MTVFAKLSYEERKSRSEQFIEEYKKKTKEADKEARKEAEGHTLSSAKTFGHYERTEEPYEYRGNGYFHILNTPNRRAVYDNAKKSYRYVYPKGIWVNKYGTEKRNFLSGDEPYKNECHHLLCVEVFSEGVNQFSYDEMKLLERVAYSINRGENQIFLPRDESDSYKHNLPHHSGGHPKYNAYISDKMNTVKEKLKELRTKPCDGNLKPTAAIVKALKSAEIKAWKWHIRKGKKLIRKSVQDHAKDEL